LIVSTLGATDDVIAAARGLAGAEQNFNPFVVSVPSICSDPTLPTTLALRGVVPLVDPAVTGSDKENANAKTSLTTPFDATGLSVAQVMAAQGFSNFTTKAVDGTVGTAPGAAAVAVSGSASASIASSSTVVAGVAATSAAVSSTAVASACIGSTTFITVTRGAASTSQAAAAVATSVASTASSASASTATGTGAVSDPVTGSSPGFVASSISGLDFGICTPTIKFEAGLNGRATTEFTFQAIDPVVNKGQQEALNPNIITNRICDQLTNVCGANAAAKTACTAAKAQILALGTRTQDTADQWNTALGFAGTNTNPDNAPQTGLVGHT